MPRKLSSERASSISVLLVSGDLQLTRRLTTAFAKAAPRFVVNRAVNRSQIESLAVPALMLLDLRLTGEPATELLRWFRADSRYRHIPVIALGSEGMELDMEKAYARS